jgi:hypothetical protein
MRARNALVLGLFVAFVACRRATAPAPSATSSTAPEPRALDAGPERLPEDPVKGARSTAQWSEHLREEERERKLKFDASHAAEHRVVIAAIEKALKSYDAAKSKAQLKGAEGRFRAALPALKKEVAAIDPDRQSSNLLPEYDALLESLSGPYPAARLAAFDGDDTAARSLAADFERRLEKAREALEFDEEKEKERERRERDERGKAEKE